MFKIANRMTKTNQGILGDQCTRKDDGYWQSLMKIRTKPGKVVMRRFSRQSLHGIGVVYLRLIKLAMHLA